MNSRNPRRLLVRIALLFFGSLVVATNLNAAPGFTYEVIYVDGQQVGEDLQVRHAAMSNNGQVVFMTQGGAGFGPITYRVYVASPGQAPQLVLETLGYGYEPTRPNIEAEGSGSIGINDNGIVAIPLIWTEYDQNNRPISNEFGYGLYEPGVGLIREIRGVRRSSGRVNNNLQIAGRDASNRNSVIVTDGLTSATTQGANNNAAVQINEQGTAATTKMHSFS